MTARKPTKRMTDDEFAEWVESPAGKEEIRSKYEQARRSGTVRRDGKVSAAIQKSGRMQTLISIRIPDEDLQKARAVAERKGIPYQTYIKMVLHEALAREPA